MSLRPNIPLHQYRGHVLTTPAAVRPVTAAELRAQLSETEDGLSDTQAEALIDEAVNLIEQMTGLAFITQVWTMALDHWPAGASPWWDGVRQMAISELNVPGRSLDLPRYPLQVVTAVTTYAEDSTPTSAVIADVFDIDVYRRPGRMSLRSGATWPVGLRASNAIVIEYRAGFGDAASDVPAILKRAIKQVAAYLYAHYGDDCVPEDALGSAGGLLGAYAVKRL